MVAYSSASSHGFRGSAIMALFDGANTVVFLPASSNREAIEAMSRVNPANMETARVSGRASEMITGPFMLIFAVLEESWNDGATTGVCSLARL